MAEPTREQLIQACAGTLPDEVLQGLAELELDDEDFLMAVFGELLSQGIDPDDFLKSKGIFELD